MAKKEIIRRLGYVANQNASGPDHVNVSINERQTDREGRIVGDANIGNYRVANADAPRTNSWVEIVITEADAPPKAEDPAVVRGPGARPTP